METPATPPESIQPADDEPSEGSVAGKLVILSIFLVTLAMAIFAVWYRQASSRQTRDLFGIEHAQRIQLATEIHVAKLPEPVRALSLSVAPPTASSDWVLVTKVSGMTHVQGALMEDRSFFWGVTEPCEPQWQYIFRFRDEHGSTHVGVDLPCAKMSILETSREVSFLPMATFLRRFVNSLYGTESATESDATRERAAADTELRLEHAVKR